MPATIPIWVISCWAALITPSSSAATSLEADDTVDGVDRPLPTPERARAMMMTTSDGLDPIWVKTTMESVRARAPATTGEPLPHFDGGVARPPGR